MHMHLRMRTPQCPHVTFVYRVIVHLECMEVIAVCWKPQRRLFVINYHWPASVRKNCSFLGGVSEPFVLI